MTIDLIVKNCVYLLREELESVTWIIDRVNSEVSLSDEEKHEIFIRIIDELSAK